MSELQYPNMGIEASTFHCPHCDADIASANQLTHELACARMQRNNQRAPMAQTIVRQSSSSAIPDQSDSLQQRAQPLPRREERRIVENRLIACPNCEKSVREQDINSHMDNECLKNEMIPCEFCEESVPMSNYSQHVQGCQRAQNQQNNNRDPSPIRNRPESHEEIEDESDDVPQEEPSEERDRSPERGSSQGGIRGFFRNLAGSAANQLRAFQETQQRLAEQRQQEREEQERRQEEMLRHMFGQPQGPRNPFANQNALVPARPNTRVVRTVEQGPGGSLIIRSRVVPVSEPQGFPGMMPSHPMQMNGMGNMDPLRLLLGLMNGEMGGMQAIGNGQMMPNNQQQQETGLSKETIDSLALVKYDRNMNKNLDEESRNCPICLDQFEEGQEVRFLWCLHRFHRNCVDQWLEKHTNCPICKKDFSEAEQGYSP